MPANLTPDYMAAELEYKQAKTNQERMAALEKMLATVPKHKGTEKIQADIKNKLKKLRELEEKGTAKGARRSISYNVPREGAGQALVIGPANSGKSSLLGFFTKAPVEIADYPFTTHRLQPGMMPYQNVQIQLVDSPALSPETFEPWMTSVMRSADMLVLTVDLASPALLEDIEFIRQKLREHKVEMVSKAVQKVDGEGRAWLKTLMVGTHLDVDGAKDNLEVLADIYGKEFLLMSMSFKTGQGTERFPETVFQTLEVVRVYTKTPGKPPDKSDPVVLKAGSTVYDFAEGIHKQLAGHLKFARIWSKNKPDGLRVARDYVLEDEDVCELHG
jgi:hypothetical protein